MTLEQLFFVFGAGTVICPALLLLIVGVPPLVEWKLEEKTIARWTFSTVMASLSMAFAILVAMLISGERKVRIEFGNWILIEPAHFHFHLSFVFDRLSVPFAILSFVLVGAIGAFANRYLHREPGYNRFFLFFAIFLLGMIVASLAGTIETLFLGWELVGLSSALLVAFFHERRAPVVNGQRIWSMYRIADASFLVAAVLLHHLTGEGDFSVLMGEGAWPEGTSVLTSNEALLVGLLLLIAAAGKSALIPFSGWLPRAMEGPTPSSAVFYGALSVHLGTFLLLRVSPLLDESILLSAIVLVLGLATSLLATLTARVQTDVKSALAYASLTQVGLITAEIGLGFRYLALVHIIGHACLRTSQLVRAPSLLHEYHAMENAIGAHLPRNDGWVERWVPERLRLRLYRLALERGMLDGIIDEFIVAPFVGIFRLFDRWERAWTVLLGGKPAVEADRADEHGGMP